MTSRAPAPARALDMDSLVLDRATRIVVTCGSGGVGKTTTAAAMALRAAEAGRRTVVLTIDPARRLAQAMGLTELDNTPRPVKDIDESSAGGALHAMMLDMKRTFDDVVSAHSTPDRAEEIFANPFYQALSSSFAGTQEYMAMEKLSQLAESDEWDLIVVDTPPSRSALDFLDAPERLGRFLDGRMIRLLAAPARAGGRAYLKVVTAGFSVFSQGGLQDPRRRAPLRRVGVRGRARDDVRRLPPTRRAHLRTAEGSGHSIRCRGRTGTGRPAGSVILHCPAPR